MTYFNEFGQARLGWNVGTPSSGGGSTVDTDAQAFITAANITDTTQKSAINTLVTQLKTYGIWTKMKAIYPFVGGTASSHKFNLKDPRDLDAAFRLVFAGGWAHSSTGALPNGSNAYADTKMNANTNLSPSSSHLSIYNTTANTVGTSRVYMGVMSPANEFTILSFGKSGTKEVGNIGSYSTEYVGDINAFAGLKTIATNGSRLASYYQNGSKINSVTQVAAIASGNIYVGAANELPAGANFFQNVNLAYSSIGDGLTDAEAANLYTAVQTFQTTLGRQVGVPIVADSDAQAFLNAAVITNQTQANAINTLVTDLKAANIWTKMKAIYPFVGGTSSSHRFNLKAPTTNTSDFYLTPYGGITHSSTGVQFNGTTGYYDTNLLATSVQSTNHLSFYSRTVTVGVTCEIGIWDNSLATFNQLRADENYVGGNATSVTYFVSIGDARGFWQGSKNSSTSRKTYKNGVLINTVTTSDTSSFPAGNMYLGARNQLNFGTPTQLYTNKECAFASIGDGLTDAEATAFYNAVQAYQTTLGRQI